MLSAAGVGNPPKACPRIAGPCVSCSRSRIYRAVVNSVRKAALLRTSQAGRRVQLQFKNSAQHTIRRSSRRPGVARASGRPDVVVTREAGKNGELALRLRECNFNVLELPLVETGEGPDRERLVAALMEDSFDYVIITSPESAAVFIACWRAAGQPQVNIAVVGTGTGRVLLEAGSPTLRPTFVPSQADAVHLSAELPLLHNSKHRVLYPASEKAGSDLQNGLAARGVEVLRLNTYTTRPVASISEDQLRLARQARVLAIASPSAIKAWAHLVGLEGGCPAVACIGTTSARAAQGLGLKDVFAPTKPGLDGFVESIKEALDATSAVPAA